MSQRWLLLPAAALAVALALPVGGRAEDKSAPQQDRIEGMPVLAFPYVHPFAYIGWPVLRMSPFRTSSSTYISSYPPSANGDDVVRPGRRTRISTYYTPPYYAPFYVQRQRIDDFYTGNGRTTRTSNYPPADNANANTTGPAHFEVRLPDDAQLTVDGKKTSQTGTTRTFSTPDLKPNQEYVYEMHAEWQDRDRKITQTRKITFHAGQQVKVDFTKPPPEKKQGEELAMPKTK